MPANAADTPPATVLLASELGGGLGHAMIALRIGGELAARGLRAVVACPDPTRLGDRPGAEAVRIERGLVPRRDPAIAVDDYLARSFADVLAWWSFGDPERVTEYLAFWRDALDRLRPALVVAEHAPSLCLLLRGDPRLLVIGNGFCLPPSREPRFPVIVPGARPLLAEGMLEAAIGKALAAHALPPLQRLTDIYAARCRLTVLPQLDPWLDLRERPPIGPIDVALRQQPMPAGARWFAYLDAGAACTAPVLRLLAASGVPGSAYLRDPARLGDLGTRLLEAGVLHPQPKPYDAELARASLVVHHGSAGLAQAALAAGRPQLLLPVDLEKRLYAQMLASLGVAQVLDGRYTGADVLRALKALHGAAPRRAALATAARIADAGPWLPMQRLLDACAEVLPALRP